MKEINESQKEMIKKNILRNMPYRRGNPQSFKQGDEVCYINAIGNVIRATVGDASGETLYFNNGDWCYAWGAINMENARNLGL